jgi:hypothetical protein
VLRVLDPEGVPVDGFTYRVQEHPSSSTISVYICVQPAEPVKNDSNCHAVPSGLSIGTSMAGDVGVVVAHIGIHGDKVQVASGYGYEDWTLILLANPAPEQHGKLLLSADPVKHEEMLEGILDRIVISDRTLHASKIVMNLLAKAESDDSSMTIAVSTPGKQSIYDEMSRDLTVFAKHLTDRFSEFIWVDKGDLRGRYLHRHKGKKPKRGWLGKYRHVRPQEIVEVNIDFHLKG